MPTSLDPPPGDDELECGRCGAHFYHELTRCPNCGVDIFEPEDESGPHQGTEADRAGLAARMDAFLRRFTKKPYAVEELFGASINQADLFENLLRKVAGDRAAAERLIDFERTQHPNGNRLAWLTSAIARWERDNQSTGSGRSGE